MLGQYADRVDEIERLIRKAVRGNIALDQRDVAHADPVRANRVARLNQHCGRCVETHQRARLAHAPEITAGAAPEVEHVDRIREAAAHLLQPGNEVLVGRFLLERLVAIAILARVGIVVERFGFHVGL